MATADKQNDGWVSLSQAASTDEGKRQLTDGLANGSYLVRYIDEHSLVRYVGHEGEQRLDVQGWRVGRLPEHFVRLGHFDWTWGTLTHAGRTLQMIQIQFPKDEPAAAEPVAAPAADRGPGRASREDEIKTEARRILAERRPASKTASAKAIHRQLGVGLSTAKRWASPVWDE